ncbi:MAG: keto-hydroxyglutarate-aldolase/keto-deoxy-phosphogluconate aldolase, partial [Eubacteriales bacterium]
PGVTSPSQVEQAIELGLDVVKFFPAEAAGGLNMIKSMAAPYTKMKFMPTGGISAKNINSYLAFNKIIACGGSWMVSGDLVKAGAFDEITKLTREAVMTMLGFEIRHVGINCENEAEADATATLFDSMFGFTKKVGNSSIFAGTAVEVMKTPFLGAHGHIAIATNSTFRAVAYLESLGYEFDYDTAKYDANGKVTIIYFKGEVSGFAIHLVQK